MVYTGIINEIKNDGPIRTFPLMRISYPFEDSNPHNILMPIPRIWYRIVGGWNSTESLIILLLTDPNDSWAHYTIKHCSMNKSLWEPIFREFKKINIQYLLLCQLEKKIIFKNEDEAFLPEDSIKNPDEFIIKEIFKYE